MKRGHSQLHACQQRSSYNWTGACVTAQCATSRHGNQPLTVATAGSTAGLEDTHLHPAATCRTRPCMHGALACGTAGLHCALVKHALAVRDMSTLRHEPMEAANSQTDTLVRASAGQANKSGHAQSAACYNKRVAAQGHAEPQPRCACLEACGHSPCCVAQTLERKRSWCDALSRGSVAREVQ